LAQHPASAARLFQRFLRPLLAQVLEQRATGVLIASTALLQLGLMRWELPAWECPMQHALGIPCPGCGLSRAITALLHGDWHAALRLHAFAPIVLAVLALITAMAVLPEPLRRRGVAAVARFERRTGLTALVLVALMAYWLARVLVFRSAFIDSIIGCHPIHRSGE
jgi:hypothetical protein